MSHIRKVAPASRKATHQLAKADADFTRLLGLQWHEAPDAETRAEIELLVKAAEMGFRLATRCTACGAWISNPVSIRRHLGPVCAKKAVQP
jgi:hypothetical protein